MSTPTDDVPDVPGDGATPAAVPGTRRPRRVPRWRRALRAAREARTVAPPPHDETLDDVLAHAPPPPATPPGPAAARPDEAEGPFGPLGTAFNRSHPFYLGFVGAVGVLVALLLARAVTELAQVITFVLIAFFLALALEPVVDALERRGLPRPAGIVAVFGGLLVLVGSFVAAVIPVLVEQAAELVQAVPDTVADIQGQRWFLDLDQRYDVVGRVSAEVTEALTTGDGLQVVAGGLVGAGQAVVSGVVSTLTVLVLTLYLLASLRAARAAGYRLVPASRRRRVQLLGDEISRRIGGYVIGQLSLATLNGVLTYVLVLVLDLPYAIVLAVTVGLLGVIPLIGATLGAVVVAVVALATSPWLALVVAIYYLVYQQLENYVLAPRIMQRTVSVPGAVALVAALAGGSLLGLLGALVAIPLAAGVLLVVQEVVVPRQDRS